MEFYKIPTQFSFKVNIKYSYCRGFSMPTWGGPNRKQVRFVLRTDGFLIPCLPSHRFLNDNTPVVKFSFLYKKKKTLFFSSSPFRRFKRYGQLVDRLSFSFSLLASEYLDYLHIQMMQQESTHIPQRLVCGRRYIQSVSVNQYRH